MTSEDSICKRQLSVGSRLEDRYEILAVLGKGGMGIVYKCLNLQLGQIVAAKFLSSVAPEQARRFFNEAKLLASLRHPNIVQINAVDVWDGQPFIVMEYVDGLDLRDFLRTHKGLSVAEIVDLFQQICTGVAHAHEEGIVHRDLKPANVLVTESGVAGRRVKLVDFGIARLAQSAEGEMQRLTREGTILGSPHYMSPEQCTGNEVDARSDIYSVGCMLYEALTKRLPFDGSNAFETLSMQVSATPGALDQVPLRLGRCIFKALEKRPEARYQSMLDFRDDLALAVRGTDQIGNVKASSRRTVLSKSRKRNLILAGAGVAVAGLCFLVPQFMPLPATRLEQENPEVLYIEGLKASKARKLDKALELQARAAKCAEIDARNPELAIQIAVQLAHLNSQVRNFPEMEKHARAAEALIFSLQNKNAHYESIKSCQVQVDFFHALYYQHRKEYPKAQDYFRKVLKADPIIPGGRLAPLQSVVVPHLISVAWHLNESEVAEQTFPLATRVFFEADADSRQLMLGVLGIEYARPSTPPLMRAAYLQFLGECQLFLHHVEPAMKFAIKSYELRRQNNARPAALNASRLLKARCLRDGGHIAEAVTEYELILDTMGELGMKNSTEFATISTELAMMSLGTSEDGNKRAVRQLLAAEAILQTKPELRKNLYSVRRALMMGAYSTHDTALQDAALARLERSQALMPPDDPNIADWEKLAWSARAENLSLHGRHQQAADLYKKIVGSPPQGTDILPDEFALDQMKYAATLLTLQRYDQAEPYLTAAIETFTRMKRPEHLAQCMCYMAGLKSAQLKYREADQYFGKAISLYSKLGQNQFADHWRLKAEELRKDVALAESQQRERKAKLR